MAELPKVRKDVDDLSKPEKRLSWRRTLTSALTAVAASVALGSVSVPPAQASPDPGVATTSSLGAPTGPAKLVFQSTLPPVQAADHSSHESPSSHFPPLSHYSGFSG